MQAALDISNIGPLKVKGHKQPVRKSYMHRDRTALNPFTIQFYSILFWLLHNPGSTQASLCEICGSQSGKSTDSSPITTIPKTLHTHYCTHCATPHLHRQHSKSKQFFLNDSYNSALGVRLNGGPLQNLVWDGFTGTAEVIIQKYQNWSRLKSSRMFVTIL